MGTFADSLFTVLMGWVRGLVNALWALFSSDHTTVLEFFGKNWLVIAVVIIGGGLVIDWIIWLLRWQPYHLWAQRARRLLRIEEPEEEEETSTRAHAAVMPKKRVYTEEQLDESREIEQYAPDYSDIGEEEEEAVLGMAQSAPDEHTYPGMRYDSVAQEEMSSTQRYGAVTQEGPGAAEVARRRAEIEAWQLHMQQEARARAEAERAQREAQQAEEARLAKEAYEAEQARIAQEAYEAEQARLAQQAYEAEQARIAQEAYEAEQARLAQQEYERQMEEYERQKAQYERDLAEYERQKAEYEAQLALENAKQEQAAEIVPQPGLRRRRTAAQTYSDYVPGETVEELPQAPEWPQMADTQPVPAVKPGRQHKLLDRMAKMIEPEEEELAQRTKLPPRVNMQDAYKPAAAPRKPGRRSRNA